MKMSLTRVLLAGYCFASVFLVSCQHTAPEGGDEPAAESTGEREDSLESLAKAARKHPRDADAQYRYGNALFDEGRFEEARDAYRACVDADDSRAGAHCNLGLTLRRLGDTEGAISAYERALALEPSDSITWSNLYSAYVSSGRMEDALRAIERIHRLNPDDPAVALEYAEYLFRERDFGKALPVYAQLAAAEPRLDMAHFRLGFCYYRLQRYDEAEKAWLYGLTIRPDNAEILKSLPILYWEQKAYSEAWRAVRICQSRGISLSPEFIAALQAESGQLGPE